MTASLETRPLLFVRAIATRRRPHLLGEVLVVLALLRVYDLARAQAEVRAAPAISHGESILALERALRISVEQAANLWVASHRLLALAASDVYQFAHLTVTLSVLAWCWLRRPELYRAARNALVAINVVGLTLFLLLPVAPPRLLPGAGFVDAVAQAGFGSSHRGPVAADQYGAMPSLHLAWAVWATVIAIRLLSGRRWRLLCWVYPVVISAVVVVTANHYLLDVLVGAAVAMAALAATAAGRGPLAGRLRPTIAD